MLQTLFAHCPVRMLFALEDLQAISCTYRSCSWRKVMQHSSECRSHRVERCLPLP